MIALVVGLVICVAFAVLTALAQTGALRRWWQRGPGPMAAGYRGINIVSDGDEPLANVPEPGGLPGAEPLTPFPCPAISMAYPYEVVSEAKPATCDMHGRPLDAPGDAGPHGDMRGHLSVCVGAHGRFGGGDGAFPDWFVTDGVTGDAAAEERARMDAERVAEVEALLMQRPKGYRPPGTYR